MRNIAQPTAERSSLLYDFLYQWYCFIVRGLPENLGKVRNITIGSQYMNVLTR